MSDDPGEHIWRVSSVSFEDDGAWTEYSCDLCPALLVVPPGGVHPEEA